jgi:hypothetical protein
VTRRVVDATIIAAVGAIAIAQSWMRWLDPIVDTGRDLYIPEQLAHGVKLYRDILYFYPPLTPYLLAAVTAVTGHSIAAYVAIGIAIAAATAIVIYALALRVANEVAALTAAATFAACSIAGQSTWGTNYIFPYAHAATLAMLFFMGMVLALVPVQDRRPRVSGQAGRLSSTGLAVLLGVAATWTKVEYAAFTLIVLIVATFALRLRVWILASYVALNAVVFAVVSFVFRDCDWLHGNVLPDVMRNSAALRTFYASVAGFDDWPAYLGESILAAVALIVIALALRRGYVAVACVLAVAIGATGYFFVAWSVLQLALIPLAFKRPPLAILLAASLCASSRVFLHLTPIWYGFVFVVPLYALAAYVLFALLPQIGLYRERASRAWVAAFAGAALHSLVLAHGAYAKKIHPIETPRGTIYDANATRAAALNELGHSGIRSLVVMPEGLAINYLFRIPTPLKFYTFTPPETADPRAEEAILRDLEAKQPEWIAIVPRDVSEFGSRGFGVDYDQRVMAYLHAHYSRSGAERNGWIVLLRKLELPRR